jgi:hypothetical protein
VEKVVPARVDYDDSFRRNLLAVFQLCSQPAELVPNIIAAAPRLSEIEDAPRSH